MTFLPIVARELRVASRRRSTYFIRAGGACALIILGAWIYFVSHDTPRTLGLELFGNLAGAAVLYALFSGVRYTADCISHEKREGTLGLLFLTDLKGYDVVFGKLAGTSLNACYGLLAVIPLLAIPLLLGGTTFGEFGRIALVALNTLFFSLSIGLGVSAMSRSARKAAALTMLLIILFAVLFPATGALLAAYFKKPRLYQPFLFPSAGYSFYMALSTSYKANPKLFWWSMGVIHGLGWFFFILSILIVPRSWQEKPAGAQTLRWRERWRQWSYGNAAARKSFRSRLLDTNPFYWLVSRTRVKPALVWAALCLVAALWAWALLKNPGDWLDTGWYLVTGVLLNTILKLWVCLEAGRQLADDRENGTLELLLSTPLSVREILRGQRLSLQRQFLQPLAVTIATFVILMFASMKTDIPEQNSWVKIWLAGIVLLIADIIALYWVGMWQALRSRHPNRAAIGSAVRVLILPWVAFLLIASLVVAISKSAGNDTGNFFFCLWVALGLIADLGFGCWARYRLLSGFRLISAERPGSGPSLLRRLFAMSKNAHEGGSVRREPEVEFPVR